MNTPRTYKITRDGVTVGETRTYTDAFIFLLRQQGQSAEWAMTHEGWDIITPDGDSMARAEGLVK